MTELSSEELRRYGRQIVMPEVTLAGQQRLKGARVLCVGAGGLGSPLALYLTAAGIGTLGLVDFDEVDLSNIQRQVLYVSEDVGRSKLAAACEHLSRLNPNTTVTSHDARLASENVMAIAGAYDILVDASDNFPTRYLLNDAAVILGKPVVHASVFRFEGQLSVFDATRGPCYRCLFPEPPPAGMVPSCAEGGVLGMLPGIIGSLQALEVVKLILGQGESLLGRLLLFDGLRATWRELPVKKDPACPVCGARPTILVPEEQALSGADTCRAGSRFARISPEDLAALMSGAERVVLVDVREATEFAIAAIPGSVSIPLAELQRRVSELDPDRTHVLSCHHGPRSERAYAMLQSAGFDRLLLLEGGIDGWAARVDPDMPRY